MTPPDSPSPAAGSPTALLVSGSGHWADPWHPYPATSARLARLLEQDGLRVTTREDVADALVALADQPDAPALVVLNVGNTDGPSPDVATGELGELGELPTLPVLEAVAAGLAAHLDRGGAVLAMHSTATAVASQDLWSRLLGGRWVRGRTMHPPLDACTVAVRTGTHPVTDELADFDVTDERYSWLHTEDDVTVLVEHHHAGERHPLVWVREHPASGAGGRPGRVLFDALGHDERSYDSPGHVALLRQGLTWLRDRS